MRWIRLLLICCWLLALAPSAAAAAPDRPHGAGLVIRHGDGRVVYVFVPFDEPEITGADLLSRSGLALVVTSYASLGLAVCTLDHEGCPASDCFCQSRGTPSWYWHYERLGPDGKWVGNPIGPSSRTIHDGDVDGWSWSTQGGELPQTSIDEIARISGVLTVATPAPVATSAQLSPVAALSTAQPSTAAPVPLPATPLARAVEVEPSGQTRAVAPAPAAPSGPGLASLAGFGLVAGLVLLAAGVLILKRRRAR